MIDIAVILPTRGLVFTETENAISGNTEGITSKVYRSHDLVIPDSQNYLVDQALADKAKYLWFVEEDTVAPDNALADMLEMEADIACIDYGVAGWSCLTKDKETNEILWCGLGCTLIKAEVFEALERPYFRSDRALLLNFWPEIRWVDAGEQAYGLQDIWFFVHAREAGFRIQQVQGECKHLKLDSLGRPEINKGLHQISRKPVISKYQEL